MRRNGAQAAGGWRKGGLVGLALAVVSLAVASGAGASSQGAPPQGQPSGHADLKRSAIGSPSSPRLDSRLARIATISITRGNTVAADDGRTLGLHVEGTGVRVVIQTTDPVATRAAVESVGGRVEATSGPLVQALVAPSMMRSLAATPNVGYIRPPLPSHEDAVTGEGIAASNASAWQAAGRGGAGVKVAVVDFGFNGYAQRQAEGDLPNSLTTVDLCGGAVTTGGEHGTAVAEILHEMAPDAQLYLICIDSEVTLAEAEQYAKSNGITIVAHSVSWFDDGRGDGTSAPGMPDATVADARANGILWVNSAGNYAMQHWGGNYSDTDHDGLLNFKSGSNFDGFYLYAGDQACVTLKWDAWPVTRQDFDLELVDQFLDIVAHSYNDQSGDDTNGPPLPPTEDFCYTNDTGVDQYFWIDVPLFDATTKPRMDIFEFGGDSTLQYATAPQSVTEPASSPNALAVGAMCFSQSKIEPYSSQGPTISNKVKPDITGPDFVSTETYGPFQPPSPGNPYCGDNGFSGTSSSAPHVAGAAALLSQRFPMAGPAQLQSLLMSNAQDLGAKGTDSIYGAGKLHLPSIALPPVTSFSPASGPIGTVVTINGSGFTGATQVAFNGHPALTVTNVTQTSLKAVVPDDASTGKITVTSPDGTGTSTADFKVTPKITGFSPASAKRGDPITVNGLNLLGATKVVFGSVSVTLPSPSASDAAITVNVPSNAVSGKITVTTPSGSGVSVDPLTVILPPKITSFTPTAGAIGDAVVTVTGTALDSVTSASVNLVDVGPVNHIGTTKLSFTVPGTATSGTIAVDGAGGPATSTAVFKVLPRIDSFDPPTGSRTTTSVDIKGVSFLGATKVAIGAGSVTIPASSSDTEITVNVPAAATSGKITVTTPSGSGSSGGSFVVILPPKITSFSPASGPVGTTVTVNGTSLDTVDHLKIHGVDVDNLTTVSATKLTFQVPAGSATDKLDATGSGGEAFSSAAFKISPKVTGFSVPQAHIGDPVEIDGLNFLGATKVAFGSVSVTLPAPSTSDTAITVNVPQKAVSGKITVTTPSGTGTSTDSLLVLQTPKLTSFSPASGPVGATVTVTGTNLDSATGATINGVPVDSFAHVGATKLTFKVPTGAATGVLAVKWEGPDLDASKNFLVSPTVTGFTPTSGARTTPVTINGVNFLGATKVAFGSVSVTLPSPSASDTAITVNVPSNAVSGKITVTTPAGSGVSQTAFLVVQAPTIKSFTPTSGPVGTLVTVSGTNLDSVLTATLNGVSAAVTPVSATQLKVTVPAGAASGKIGVGGLGGPALSTAVFKVTPKITGFTPTSGARGSGVVIQGTTFTGATKVAFGSAAATFSVDSDSQITTTVPSNAATGKITVTTPAGSAVSTGTYTVTTAAAPAVLKVDLSGTDVDFTDPALAYFGPSWQLLHTTCANLVRYPDTANPTTVEPEVAASLPDISDGGKLYTFTIRDDYRFSPPSNQLVTAQTFKAVFDRLADMQSPAEPFIQDIASVSVVNGQLLILLNKPSGDFLARLALPWFCAVPIGTPATAQTTLASAGPYYVASRTVGSSIVLRRNPYYAGDRPHAFDEIDYAVNTVADTSRTAIEAGDADYEAGFLPEAAQTRLFDTYGPGSAAATAGHQQYFVDPSLTTFYLALNTSRTAFSDVRVRKAVNFALDRKALVATRGAHAATATDQALPPGMPGFRDGDIYPLNGPDVAAAQAALPPDFTGAAVTLYAGNSFLSTQQANIVKQDLAAINITVTIDQFTGGQLVARCGTKTEPFDICMSGWSADYPDPADFLFLFDGSTIQDTGNNNYSYLNDATINQRLADASPLTGALRLTTYGDLDVDLAHDYAPWAAWGNVNSRDLFSARIGCQTYQAMFGMDLAALCLR